MYLELMMFMSPEYKIIGMALKIVCPNKRDQVDAVIICIIMTQKIWIQ